MPDHDVWEWFDTSITAIQANFDTDWKTADDAQLATIIDTSKLTSGELSDLEDVWHKYRRHPHKGLMTSGDYATLQSLFNKAEP